MNSPRIVVTVGEDGSINVYSDCPIDARIVSLDIGDADNAQVIPYSPISEDIEPTLGLVFEAEDGLDVDFVSRVFNLEPNE